MEIKEKTNSIKRFPLMCKSLLHAKHHPLISLRYLNRYGAGSGAGAEAGAGAAETERGRA